MQALCRTICSTVAYGDEWSEREFADPPREKPPGEIPMKTKVLKPTARASASGPLSGEELRLMDAYWRASNYLSVGQIYLLDNPMLKQPLVREHVKPRLVGHWGTTPGLNFIYVHLNRIINNHDLNMIYIAGPGHGGPALGAHAYMEGTHI